MKTLRRIFTIVMFSISWNLFAQYNKMNVPESAEIRKKAAESWFYDDLQEVRAKSFETHENSVGETFQIRMEEQEGIFYIIIAPQIFMPVDLYTESGIRHEISGEFPGDGRGSFVMARNSEDGSPIFIRFYFMNDSDVYVQFRSEGKKTLADFVIGELNAAKAVPIGIPFENLYTMSFADILTLTEKTLPWKYTEIVPNQYKNKLYMVSAIRNNLPRVYSEWDAAYDENGRSIRISVNKFRDVSPEEKESNTIHVSAEGFLKWIVDGLVKPVAGSGLYLNPLLRPTTSKHPLGYAGIKQKEEALDYTLDWTRNLAAARVSVQTKKKYLYEDSGVDVTIEPFSSEVSDEGIVQVAGYLKNTGYRTKNLRQILYVLAATEPNYFYLTAIRRLVPQYDGKPEFYTFDRCAVIFPYFDSNGQFDCAIFENGVELSLSEFVNKYGTAFVHLTRVLASEKFSPQ